MHGYVLESLIPVTIAFDYCQQSQPAQLLESDLRIDECWIVSQMVSVRKIASPFLSRWRRLSTRT
jgi:hypothetical protein